MSNMYDDAMNSAAVYNSESPQTNIDAETWAGLRRNFENLPEALEFAKNGEWNLFVTAFDAAIEAVENAEVNILNSIRRLHGDILVLKSLEHVAHCLSVIGFKDRAEEEALFVEAWKIKNNGLNALIKRYLAACERPLGCSAEATFIEYGQKSMSRTNKQPSFREMVERNSARKKLHDAATVAAALSNGTAPNYQTCDCNPCKFFRQMVSGEINGYGYVMAVIADSREEGDSEEHILERIAHLFRTVKLLQDAGKADGLPLGLEDIAEAANCSGFRAYYTSDEGWQVEMVNSTKVNGAESPPSKAANGIAEPEGSAPSSEG